MIRTLLYSLLTYAGLMALDKICASPDRPSGLGRAHLEPMWVVYLTRIGIFSMIVAGYSDSAEWLIAGLLCCTVAGLSYLGLTLQYMLPKRKHGIKN